MLSFLYEAIQKKHPLPIIFFMCTILKKHLSKYLTKIKNGGRI